jgi:hypothetical protein
MLLKQSRCSLRLGSALMLLARATCIAVAVGFIAYGAPVRAQNPAPAQSAARDSIRQLGLQDQLPRDPSNEGSGIQIPPEIVWGALLVGLLLVLYAFRDMLPIWRLWSGGGWQPPGAAGQPEALASSAADDAAAADELGRQGRFVEAMHTLLLLSLAEIRRHLGEQFADSLTSREILRGARLPARGRALLREIVARVEWTYFGGYPATIEDYTACRQSFDGLRGVLRGEPSA